jgi:outer membrane protein assembly factor BamB
MFRIKMSIKFSRFFALVTLLLLSPLLAACGGQVMETWPGVALDPSSSTIYLAAGPTIYAVSLDGKEQAATAKDNEDGAAFYAAPAFAGNNRLVLGSYNHKVYQFAPGSSAPDWKFESAKDRFIATPWIGEDIILAPSADGTLYALDGSGKEKWTFKAGHGLWSTPLVKEDKIYISSLDHHLYALNLADGKQIWKSEDLGGQLVATPVLSDEGLLYVGVFGSVTDDQNKTSRLAAVNAADGSTAWWTPVRGWVWAAPVLSDGVLYFGDQEGYIYALDAKEGQPVWSARQLDNSAARAIVAAPLIVEDKLYIGNKAGNLYAINLADGSESWMKPVGGQIYTTPLLVNDLLVIAPMNFESLLVTFQLNGSPGWTFTPAQ